MIRRLALVAALALGVAGLLRLDDPHAAPTPTRDPLVGPSLDARADATTWYCAAGGGDLEHRIVITSFTEDVTARVTGYTSETGGARSVDVDVPARSQQVVTVADIGPGIGGVTVETRGGGATVSHRIAGATVEDESSCAVAASDRWYFASANTELVNQEFQSTVQLWLFNPFPTDASVDVRVTYDDTVRVPPKLRGVIVPAGSSRVVELSTEVQRHEQFAFTVDVRGGRVVAEVAQTVAGSGLRLQPGVPATSTEWFLADAFGGANLSERLHVYNPSADDVTVTVSVMPNNTDPAAFPEPFVYDIAPRRYVTVDLMAETRLPADGLRSIRVDTVTGPGVVVTQVDAITGAGGDGSTGVRPAVAGGLSSSTGSSAQSTRWFVTSVGPGSDGQPSIVVSNPSPDAIAVIELISVSGGERSTIADGLEVPPQQSLVVDVAEAAAAGAIGVEVVSSSPVVASARMTSTARVDLWMVPAIADRDAASALPGNG